MRKKICFVTTVSATIKAFLLDLAQYLVENCDFDVTFICGRDESMFEFTSEHVHYIPIKMKRGFSMDGLSVVIQLYRIFRKEKFDIVQYSTRNAATYGSIAAKLAGVKCRLYCQWGMMFVAMKGLKRVILKMDEKLICLLSNVIEVESHSMYDDAIRYGIYTPEKASIIWNGSACGVDLDKYLVQNKPLWRKEIREKYGVEDNAVVFGYCGRITRDKGLNELFQAFRCVLESRSAYLFIIGSYDNAETIQPELMNWAHSCPNVIFTGFTREVSKHYSALDVFTSLSYREGFGLVVIEAAAMGVPGIVTNVIGQRDTIEDGITGISVPGHDVEHVVEAMAYFIDNPNKAKEMGIAARKNVEQKYEQKELFRRLAEHRCQLLNEGMN